MTLAAMVLALFALSPADEGGLPLLLDFHASWCGPCRTMRPAVESLARAGYPIKSIDIDESPELAKRYGITGVPAFVIVDRDGTELERTTGAQPATEIAGLYRKVQAKLQAAANDRRDSGSSDGAQPAHRGRATLVSNDDESEEPATRSPNRSSSEGEIDFERAEIPKPWETVVRIKMHLSPQEVGYGSGTVIHSTAEEAIILTCAHIFKLPDRPTPPPARFPVRIDVDLFDGRLSETSPRTVHFKETLQGQAIDYDFINDVGLIRIRPGRRLPSSPIVPVTWKPERGLEMITVGCSEGHDATAWSTRILTPNAGLQHVKNGKAIPFTVIECEHAPKQGRSGGGLYTKDGMLAGVCDFADMQAKKGLYATPKSIYQLLDRNSLASLYRGPSRDDQRLLADNEPTTRRPKTKVLGQNSGAVPAGAEFTLPDPIMLGIPQPQLAANDSPAESADRGKRTWQTRGSGTSNASKPSSPTTAELVADPAPSDRDPRATDELLDPADDRRDILQPPGRSKWRKISKVSGDL